MLPPLRIIGMKRSSSWLFILRSLILSFYFATNYCKRRHIPDPTADVLHCCFFFNYTSDYQSFSSHGTHKLITKILWHTKKYIFCRSDQKNRWMIWFIHTRWPLWCWLLPFLKKFDSQKEKWSMSLTKLSGIACFENSCGKPVCLL